MLELQTTEYEVFAFYRSLEHLPNVGSSLARVFPGGSFKGMPFDRLVALGNGRHMVEVDERAECERGAEPTELSEKERPMEAYRWELFRYTVGACTAEEVLTSAREVV